MTPVVWMPIASVVVIYFARLKELATRRDTIPGPVKEHLTLWMFVLAGSLMLVCSLAEFLWRGEQLRWPTFVAGWICAAGSFALRRRAIAALGKFWSLHVEIREQHQFVRSGPFRWVRHPTYLSMFLELLVAPLILNVRYSLLVMPLLFLPALLARLRIEEAALVEKFGDEYRYYQQTTPSLIPYKWPRQ